jgi:predicted helicase
MLPGVSIPNCFPLPPRPLRDHQRDAVDAVRTGAARQQIVMACGTGKTLTGMHAAAKLLGRRGGHVLLLVPTLTLLEQTAQAWRADAPFDFCALAVCSRLSAAERGAAGVETDIDPAELSLRATTDPAEIARFRSGEGTRIVFATYQSLPAIIAAHHDEGAAAWDVVVCDFSSRIHAVRHVRQHGEMRLCHTPGRYCSRHPTRGD